MQAEKQEKREKLLVFSERLKQLAGRRGLKQRAIASALGEGSSTVGQWFRAKNFPGPSVEYRLADLLSVSRDWLIEGKEINPIKEEKEEHPWILQETAESFGSGPVSLAHLESIVRKRFEAIIRAAAGDPNRMGWIHEQLVAHLTPPNHWKDEAAEIAKAKTLLQAMKDEAAAERSVKNKKDQAS